MAAAFLPHKRWTLTNTKLQNSNRIHSASIVISETVNATGRSVFTGAIIGYCTRTFCLVNLLSTAEQTEVFVSETS